MKKVFNMILVIRLFMIASVIVGLFMAWEVCKLNPHPSEGADQRISKLSQRQTVCWFVGVHILAFSFLVAVVVLSVLVCHPVVG